MARLQYSMVTSLDGFIEGPDGKFDWTMPDEEVLKFINDRERRVGTYLFGRRMYETMACWDNPSFAAESPGMRDYAQVWQGIDKIVYSRTLQAVTTARTRLERDFDPEAVQHLKDTSRATLGTGGHDLAAQLFRAGLVDECYLVLAPIVLGTGKPAFPRDLRINLELLEERRFGNGMVYLRYRTRL